MTAHQRAIVAIAMLTQGIAVGLTYGILPVFLEPLEVAFDAPRTVVSAGQIFVMGALAMGSMATGAALDRGYARPVMLGGAGLLVAALLLASFAPSLSVLAVAALMAGFSIPSVGPLAGATLITRSFADDRGRALGLMSMGPPLGSGIFAGVAGWALLSFDWRQVLLGFAAIAALFLVPSISAVVPGRFEDAGEGGSTDAQPSRQGGMAEVLRMPVFWWSAGVFALSAGISTGWTVHVAAFLGGAGLDEAERSTLLAAQFWMGVPGAVIFGLLADRIRLNTLYCVMLGCQALIFVLYAFFPTPLVVTVLGIVFGFMTGGMVPLYMMLLGQRMGPETLGRAMGLSNLVMLPVMATSVLWAATVFESTDGYRDALLAFVIGLVGAVACLFLSSRSAASRARDLRLETHMSGTELASEQTS